MEFTQEEKQVLLTALTALNEKGQSLDGSAFLINLFQKIKQETEIKEDKTE